MENQQQLSLSDEIRQTVKQNLVRLREANGLKMRDVANALGIKENTYRVWEDPQKGCPKQVDLVRIAKMYHISLDMLITGKTDTPSGGFISVHAPQGIDNDTYGEKYLSDLSRYEKIMIMKIRQMNTADRNKVNELVEEICSRFNAE